jgi:transcriptional regulator with XRE-family HTH domain
MTAQPGGAGTTVVRRQLGRRLRLLREQAGKTHEDIAAAEIASRSKMWKIETGRTRVREGDVLSLARLYELGNAVTDELLRMASATKDTGFLEHYGSSVPEWVGMYGDLEAACSELWVYASELVPGILQSPGYARAVTAVDETLSAEAIEQRVRFRAQRQAAFFEREEPGRLDAVLTEGALRLHVDSDAVMEEQIAHLRAVNDGERVSVRILPSTNGVHTAMRGPFTLLLFDDPADPDLAHVESVVGARYFERREHVAEFRRAYEWMRPKTVALEEHVR